MPALRVLMLNGNPVVSKLSQYRKTLILECKELTYLDSRPVFPRDRACAEAWKRGGCEEERKENERWNRKERDKMRENVNSTIRMRNKFLAPDKQLKLFTASDSENEDRASSDERKDNDGPVLNLEDDIWDEVRKDKQNINESPSSDPSSSSEESSKEMSISSNGSNDNKPKDDIPKKLIEVLQDSPNDKPKKLIEVLEERRIEETLESSVALPENIEAKHSHGLIGETEELHSSMEWPVTAKDVNPNHFICETAEVQKTDLESFEDTESIESDVDNTDSNQFICETEEVQNTVKIPVSFEDTESIESDVDNTDSNQLICETEEVKKTVEIPVSFEDTESIESDVDNTVFDLIDEMLEKSGKSAAEYAKEAEAETDNCKDVIQIEKEDMQEQQAVDELTESLGKLTLDVSISMQELENVQNKLTDGMTYSNEYEYKFSPKGGYELESTKETDITAYDSSDDNDSEVIKAFKKEEKEIRALLQRLEDKNEEMYGDFTDDKEDNCNEDKTNAENMCQDIINDILQNMEMNTNENALKNYKFMDLDEYEPEVKPCPSAEELDNGSTKTINHVVKGFNKMMQEMISMNRIGNPRQIKRASVNSTDEQKSESLKSLLNSSNLKEFNSQTSENLNKEVESVQLKMSKDLKKLVDRVYAQRDKYNDSLEVVNNRLMVVKQNTGEIEEIPQPRRGYASSDSSSDGENDEQFVWEGVPLLENRRVDWKKQPSSNSKSTPFGVISDTFNNVHDHSSDSDSESAEKFYSLPDNANVVANIDNDFIQKLDFVKVKLNEDASQEDPMVQCNRSYEELRNLMSGNNYKPTLTVEESNLMDLMQFLQQDTSGNISDIALQKLVDSTKINREHTEATKVIVKEIGEELKDITGNEEKANEPLISPNVNVECVESDYVEVSKLSEDNCKEAFESVGRSPINDEDVKLAEKETIETICNESEDIPAESDIGKLQIHPLKETHIGQNNQGTLAEEIEAIDLKDTIGNKEKANEPLISPNVNVESVESEDVEVPKLSEANCKEAFESIENIPINDEDVKLAGYDTIKTICKESDGIPAEIDCNVLVGPHLQIQTTKETYSGQNNQGNMAEDIEEIYLNDAVENVDANNDESVESEDEEVWQSVEGENIFKEAFERLASRLNNDEGDAKLEENEKRENLSKESEGIPAEIDIKELENAQNQIGHIPKVGAMNEEEEMEEIYVDVNDCAENTSQLEGVEKKTYLVVHSVQTYEYLGAGDNAGITQTSNACADYKGSFTCAIDEDVSDANNASTNTEISDH